jgi:hypothetical protein
MGPDWTRVRVLTAEHAHDQRARVKEAEARPEAARSNPGNSVEVVTVIEGDQ